MFDLTKFQEGDIAILRGGDRLTFSHKQDDVINILHYYKFKHSEGYYVGYMADGQYLSIGDHPDDIVGMERIVVSKNILDGVEKGDIVVLRNDDELTFAGLNKSNVTPYAFRGYQNQTKSYTADGKRYPDNKESPTDIVTIYKQGVRPPLKTITLEEAAALIKKCDYILDSSDNRWIKSKHTEKGDILFLERHGYGLNFPKELNQTVKVKGNTMFLESQYDGTRHLKLLLPHKFD